MGNIKSRLPAILAPHSCGHLAAPTSNCYVVREHVFFRPNGFQAISSLLYGKDGEGEHATCVCGDLSYPALSRIIFRAKKNRCLSECAYIIVTILSVFSSKGITKILANPSPLPRRLRITAKVQNYHPRRTRYRRGSSDRARRQLPRDTKRRYIHTYIRPYLPPPPSLSQPVR